MSDIKKRAYYSTRTGKNTAAIKPNYSVILQLFADCFKNFYDRFYFQEAFGYSCVSAGDVSGTLDGKNIEAQMFRRLRKTDLWPIASMYLDYSEDDLFDVIEFLYDFVSKPLDGWYHTGCGWHYLTFDRDAGRAEFRVEINDIIKDYSIGYEISENGEILVVAETGLEEIFDSTPPTYDPDNVDSRVQVAIHKFRRYRSSEDDRRDAIRDLADVLEFMRPKLSSVLTKKDEDDLFIIANRFGIRHRNDKQQTDYDRNVWYNWMFYYYLATIYAVIALLKRENAIIRTNKNDEIPF